MNADMQGDAGSTPAGAASGRAEVHARISTGEDVLPPAGGTSAGGGQSATDKAKDKAHELADQAKDKAGDLGDRAGELTSQARDKAADALERAEHALDERGLLRYIRENPLPVLGLAFGIGFLLAGSDDDNHRRQGNGHSSLRSAKNQLKGAVMGGLSAAVAREARSALGMGGSGGGGLLSDLLGGSSSGSSGGSGTPQRPPSHQENL